MKSSSAAARSWYLIGAAVATADSCWATNCAGTLGTTGAARAVVLAEAHATTDQAMLRA